MRKPEAGPPARLSFVDFQLPTLVDQPPEGDGWLHEVKHDGYRTELIVEQGRARALTRSGFDWSEKYRPIVDESAGLKARSAIVDGEVIVFDDHGTSDFQALRSAIRWQQERVVFVAFDIMHLDGNDLRHLPLLARRAMLQDLVRDDGGAIQFSHTSPATAPRSSRRSTSSASRAWCRSGRIRPTAPAGGRPG